MADFPAKPMSLQKAIKEALEPYDRKFMSNLVADAAFQAINISLQQNNDLPKSFSEFLKWAESHRPRVPQHLLSLPIPESEVPNNPVVCKCHYNFLCKLHYYGKDILYLDSDEPSKQVNSQELSPLQVLFGFMGES